VTIRPTIISGGQTGADRAGLDAAAALGLPTGGQAPASYRTENGPDVSLEALGLTARGSPESRTEANVIAADATVIFAAPGRSPGSDLTLRLGLKHGKPVTMIDPWEAGAEAALREFLRAHAPRILNVAGHRESQAPGIYRRVFDLMTVALRSG